MKSVDPHRLERVPLSRERVMRGALEVADAGGIGSLTIRSLARELGVKPMSVYYHVANKEQILDGIVDLVFSEIELPSPGGDWRAEMRRRAISARAVLTRHPWAIGLLESRTIPGPAALRHHDAVIGTLRAAGFSVQMTAHAYALLDSYMYGFAVQEAALPFKGLEGVAEVTAPLPHPVPADEYPHLIEMATQHILKPTYRFGDEFEPGLTVILDALSQSITADRVAAGARAQRSRVHERRLISTATRLLPAVVDAARSAARGLAASTRRALCRQRGPPPTRDAGRPAGQDETPVRQRRRRSCLARTKARAPTTAVTHSRTTPQANPQETNPSDATLPMRSPSNNPNSTLIRQTTLRRTAATKPTLGRTSLAANQARPSCAAPIGSGTVE